MWFPLWTLNSIVIDRLKYGFMTLIYKHNQWSIKGLLLMEHRPEILTSKVSLQFPSIVFRSLNGL